MKKSVYIETTIPSYYFETREGVKFVAWREITREWWLNFRCFYEPVCSDVVLYELEQGNHPSQAEKISLLSDIDRLEYTPVIDEIVDEYIKHNLVPKEYGGDAYHLAYASYYEISFLMTWNCNHLANPNKFHHMHVINGRLGLHTPIICTPEQLLTEGN